MVKVAIVYHSGYGHTQKVADAVHTGVASVRGTEAHLLAIDADGNLADEAWTILDAADAIIFGSPTYMGSVSWQFKKFADATSKLWYTQRWKDKIAAGFTNSASVNGDKLSTIHYLFTLSMQHCMIWLGVDLLPSNAKSAQRNDPNWLGCFAGLLTQAPSDASPDEAPPPGDLSLAQHFGTRIANYTLKTRGDSALTGSQR